MADANAPERLPTETPSEPRERWYSARDGVTLGPLSRAELVEKTRSGEIRPHDRVWNASFPEWVDARAVPGLFVLEVSADSGGGAPKGRVWVVSDALPLVLLGGVILCFLVYFGHDLAGETAQEAKLIGAGESYAVEICNNTEDARVFAAVAYYDDLRDDWVARGWFPQAQGECQLAVKNLKPPIYVYAETKDGSARWGDDVSGMEFCIAKHAGFVVRQKDCNGLEGAGSRRQRFKALKLNGRGGTHTWDLSQ